MNQVYFKGSKNRPNNNTITFVEDEKQEKK